MSETKVNETKVEKLEEYTFTDVQSSLKIPEGLTDAFEPLSRLVNEDKRTVERRAFRETLSFIMGGILNPTQDEKSITSKEQDRDSNISKVDAFIGQLPGEIVSKWKLRELWELKQRSLRPVEAKPKPKSFNYINNYAIGTAFFSLVPGIGFGLLDLCGADSSADRIDNLISYLYISLAAVAFSYLMICLYAHLRKTPVESKATEAPGEINVVSLDYDDCADIIFWEKCTPKWRICYAESHFKGELTPEEQKEFNSLNDTAKSYSVMEEKLSLGLKDTLNALFKKHADKFRDKLISLAKNRSLEFFTLSNRLSLKRERENVQEKGSGSSFKNYSDLCETENWHFNQLLLHDQMGQLSDGATLLQFFNPKSGFVEKSTSTFLNSSEHELHDMNFSYYDKEKSSSKILSIINQSRAIAKKQPKAIINFYCIDDRGDLLDDIKRFFTVYPQLLPKNIKLHVLQYIVEEDEPFITVFSPSPTKENTFSKKLLTFLAVSGIGLGIVSLASKINTQDSSAYLRTEIFDGNSFNAIECITIAVALMAIVAIGVNSRLQQSHVSDVRDAPEIAITKALRGINLAYPDRLKRGDA